MSGMEMLSGANIPTAFDAVSGYMAYRSNKRGAERANRDTRDSSREQMAFQERMSNSAFQRSRKDMIAAGINPMLMTNTGGAGMPSGASYKAESTTKDATTSALGAMRLSAELQNLRSQTALNQATALATTAKSAKSAALAPMWNTIKTTIGATTGGGTVKYKKPDKTQKRSIWPTIKKNPNWKKGK